MPTGTPNDPVKLLARTRQRARIEEVRVLALVRERVDEALEPFGLRMELVSRNGPIEPKPKHPPQPQPPVKRRGRGRKRKADKVKA